MKIYELLSDEIRQSIASIGAIDIDALRSKPSLNRKVPGLADNT